VTSFLIRFLDRLSAPCLRDGDSEELRSRKKIFVMGLFAAGSVSLVWGLSYTVLGLRASCLGYGAAALDFGLLALFRGGRKYLPLLYTHVAVNLILPFVAQSMVGGIERSGCLGLWAVVAPLTILVHELPGSWIWFVGFIALQFASIAAEPFCAAHVAPMAPALSRLFLLSNLAGVLAILFFPLQYVDHLRRQLKERVKLQALDLAEQHANAERLLHNILPESVARRLKANEGMVVDAHADASVLFADIAGFTRFSAELPPAELVEMLNSVFCLFDALAEEYGLEKIKTIGDAYMVVGNVTGRGEGHLDSMAEMALAMQQVFANHAAAKHGLALRQGLHCGPVVAGVIGTTKFSFDLWGDTVNVASRLESQGAVGRVQVSSAVFERLERDFILEERGTIELRGRGDMRTWWLIGRRAGAA
jgi:adenylate cyclase